MAHGLTPQTTAVLVELLQWDMRRIERDRGRNPHANYEDYVERQARAAAALESSGPLAWSVEVREYYRVMIEAAGDRVRAGQRTGGALGRLLPALFGRGAAAGQLVDNPGDFQTQQVALGGAGDRPAGLAPVEASRGGPATSDFWRLVAAAHEIGVLELLQLRGNSTWRDTKARAE